jgi:hypothetical protein
MGRKWIIDRDIYRKIKKTDREEPKKIILGYGDEQIDQTDKTFDFSTALCYNNFVQFDCSRFSMNVRI